VTVAVAAFTAAEGFQKKASSGLKFQYLNYEYCYATDVKGQHDLAERSLPGIGTHLCFVIRAWSMVEQVGLIN
jgi:hypothetical protein